MNQNQATALTNDVLIADALLRVKTLENLLVAKGLFTQEEFQTELTRVAEMITRAMLEKANVPAEDMDAVMNKLEGQTID